MRLEGETEILSDGTRVVSISGALDTRTAPGFERQLLGAIDRGDAGVIVDLTACGFFESTVLAILVAADRQLGHARARIGVVTGDRTILKIFEMSGLDGLLTTHPTRASAVNGGARA